LRPPPVVSGPQFGNLCAVCVGVCIVVVCFQGSVSVRGVQYGHCVRHKDHHGQSQSWGETKNTQSM